jgi:hypothetical protein
MTSNDKYKKYSRHHNKYLRAEERYDLQPYCRCYSRESLANGTAEAWISTMHSRDS